MHFEGRKGQKITQKRQNHVPKSPQILQDLEELEADLVDGLVALGDDLVLRGGQAHLDEGVLGLVGRNGRAADAQRRKQTAPPVLTLGLADQDAQGQVLPGGEAEAVVVAYGVLLPAERDVDGCVAAVFRERVQCGRTDQIQVVVEYGRGLLLRVTVGKQRGGHLQNGVANGELECLILLGVGVGQDVQAHDGVVDLLFSVYRK